LTYDRIEREENNIKCYSCGALIVAPLDEHRVTRCPRCTRIQRWEIVDLAYRPDIVRRLKAVRDEGPALTKSADV
jgi:phage FluMu protein Com